MLQRLPNAFIARFVIAVLLLGNVALADGGVQGDKARATAPEKSPATTIPATRPEPVVPPSPAKSIARELNDAYVNVFEHVAPAVVVIDVLKRVNPESDTDFLPDMFYPSPAPDKNNGTSREKDKGKTDREKDKEKDKEKEPKPDETPRPAPRRPLSSSEGSGFIIQPGGYILTNNHVINGAEKINVRLKDGRQFKGRVVGTDKDTDIAVVKIEASDLPTAELGNSDLLRVGQIACAIGVPYNQDYSFTAGVISAKNRYKLTPEDIGYDDYIQTDASINPGNSGGPLVDLDGRVIGMNTLINGFNRGLGFAIPSNMLREVGEQLIRSGRVVRSYLGVRIESLNLAIERYGPVFGGVKKGVLVDMITPDSPAMRSGELRPWDIITEVDGVSIGTDRELQKQIISKRIGATVQLTVVRKSKMFKVAVITAELPSEPARVFSRNEDDEPAATDENSLPPVEAPISSASPAMSPARADPWPMFGVRVMDMTKEIAVSMSSGANTAATGALVTEIQDESVADKAGLAVRDVITSVDDKAVKDAAAFREAIKTGDSRRGILCYVDRLGAKTFVVLKTE